jgi:squalene-associated FAD-dependent desaturase
MNQAKRSVAVIGAGWAGLSSAHHLVNAGLSVSVFEASSQAGGRARSAAFKLHDETICLDNGQHMLIGAYRETLDLISHCHDDSITDLISRHPLQFESSELQIVRKGAGKLGLLWGVMTGQGMTTAARLALLRFGLTLARNKWQVAKNQTVSELMAQTRQPDKLVAALWRPLCVSALNTEPELACAQTFANVVHDSMLTSNDGSDFLVPQVPLGEMLAEPLRESLNQRGAQWLSPTPVRRLVRDKEAATKAWQVHTSHEITQFDAVVLATPSATSAALLSDTHLRASATLAMLQPESIRTVYLAWKETVQIPALRMLDESTEDQNFGQWIFNRGQHGGQNVAAVVVSAANALPVSNAKLAELVSNQVASQLALPRPTDSRTVNERNATFLCTPTRPVVSAGHVDNYELPESLALAGDYCFHRYPATLEAAVISGRLASERILQTSR